MINLIRGNSSLTGALLTLLILATTTTAITVAAGTFSGPLMALSIAAIAVAWLTVALAGVGSWIVTQVRASIRDHDLAVTTGLSDIAEAVDTQSEALDTRHVDQLLAGNVRNIPRK